MSSPPTSCPIWILVGTRPEVIKQAPLYLKCRERFGADQVALIATGQHRELLDQALAHFNLTLNTNLDIMRPDQSLSLSAAQILSGLHDVFSRGKPRWIVVQGDTTSAAMAAVAGFYEQIKIAHNEAGLRSFDLTQPFPEEANRKWISAIADLHFAPTQKSCDALLREGHDPGRIFRVGNTGIDALTMTLAQPCPASLRDKIALWGANGRKIVLMTAHRRENRGKGMDDLFETIARCWATHPDLSLVYLSHPNAFGIDAARRALQGNEHVFFEAPLDYASTCHLLSRSAFVITDSGGIQEEAATLGIPAIVCRETTERTEAVELGLSRLVGTDPTNLMQGLQWAIQAGPICTQLSQSKPFGDGTASGKIVDILQKHF